jgi:hypothetical protein
MSALRPESVRPRRLPDRPNLEQLRHQAKDILKGYLSGDPDTVAEVKRIERAPTSHFMLNDAQRVLARAYGFQSWPKLKAFVDGANIVHFLAAVNAFVVRGTGRRSCHHADASRQRG